MNPSSLMNGWSWPDLVQEPTDLKRLLFSGYQTIAPHNGTTRIDPFRTFVNVFPHSMGAQVMDHQAFAEWGPLRYSRGN